MEKPLSATYHNTPSGRMLELNQGMDQIRLTREQQITVAKIIVAQFGRKILD
jgi:hypothetical protein